MKSINKFANDKVKWFLIPAFTIIFIIGVSGCMHNLSHEKEILAHLEQKYGIEFISLGFEVGSNSVMNCYPKGGCPEADRVKANIRVFSDKNTETEFGDTYFGIIIREDLEAEVFDAISDLPLPMKVFFDSETNFNNIFDSTKTYANFKQWRNNGNPWRINATVTVSINDFDNSEKEEYANKIFDIIEEDGFTGGIRVRFYSSEVFEKLTRTNFIELADDIVFSRNLNRPS